MSELTQKEFARLGQKALRKKYDIETKEKRKVYFSHLSKVGAKKRNESVAQYWAEVKSGKRARKGYKPPQTLVK